MNSMYLTFVGCLEWESANECVCGWTRQGKRAVLNLKYQKKSRCQSRNFGMYDKLHFNVNISCWHLYYSINNRVWRFSVPVVREYNSGRVSYTVIQYFVRVGRE